MNLRKDHYKLCKEIHTLGPALKVGFIYKNTTNTTRRVGQPTRGELVTEPVVRVRRQGGALIGSLGESWLARLVF